MNTNANDTAFPLIEEDENKVQRSVSQGLTKREYFAGLAMQGLCAGLTGNEKVATLAPLAVSIADALISELNKSKP